MLSHKIKDANLHLNLLRVTIKIINQLIKMKMKKNVYFFVFVLLLSLSVTSCKKDSATTNTKTTGSASVSGTLKANLDMTNDTTQNGTPQIQNENVPAGTLITFIIDSKDLQDNPDSAYVYPKLEYTTTVEANGAFSI